MRMSGLCKVEMSGFIQGGRQDGTGANRVECERTGAAEGVTRSRARTSETRGSGALFIMRFSGLARWLVMSLPMNHEIARAKLGAAKPCTWANQFGGNMPPK